MKSYSRRDDTRAKLDSLIDWYAAHKADAGKRIEMKITPAQLGKLLARAPRPGSANEFLYRDRILVATGFDATRARFLGGL